MIKSKDLRIDNYLLDGNGRLCQVSEITKKDFKAFALQGALTTMGHTGVQLTKEWAHDLGFEVTDMGDFWEFKKGDFQLIQLKVPMTGKVLTPSFVIYSVESKHIKVPYVHKLQNLYYEIKGEELIIQNK